MNQIRIDTDASSKLLINPHKQKEHKMDKKRPAKMGATRRLAGCAFAGGILLWSAMDAAATGIITYQANTNPTNFDAYVTQPGNQFWTLGTGGAGPVGTGIDDGGTLAWDVNRVGIGLGEERWSVTPLASDIAIGNAQGWKLSTRLRLPTTGIGASAGAQIDYADNVKVWGMTFGTAANGDPIVQLVNGSSFTLTGAGNGGYHDYLLAYNPLSGNADLYVDGALAIGGYSGLTLGNPFSRVFFGDAALSGNDQHVRYNMVLWVAPEPSSLALLALGGLLMWRRKGT
jgi:hypothetical protein